jgi:hypothetical protein
MKTNFMLTATVLPFIIIWQMYTYQRDQVKPDISFIRDIHKVDKESLDKLLLPIGFSPNFLNVYNKTYYISSIESRQIMSIKENKTNFYPKSQQNDDFKLVLSFSVDSNKIIVLDQISRRHVMIDVSSGIFNYIDLPLFVRGVPLNDSISVLASIDTVTKDRVFNKYNINTRQKELIKTTLPVVGDYGLSHDGFFAYSKKAKKMAYVLSHLGKVIIYDEQHQLTESFSTIDKYGFYPMVVKKGDMFFLSRKTVSVNNGIAMNENYIFIDSRIRSVEDKKNNIEGEVIDVYDIKNPNKYKYSINFSNIDLINDIKADEDFLYLLTNNEVFKYKLSDIL